MARYDRVALIDAPPRDAVFPGWPVVRDIEGRERDRKLLRRAHIRFLALRPVHRLLRVGRERVPPSSLQAQIAQAREAVAGLPRRDVERQCWNDVLDRLLDSSALDSSPYRPAPGPDDLVPNPNELATALLAAGRCAERQRHHHGAEEVYRTALDWAVAHDLRDRRVDALIDLGRLCARTGRLDEALGQCRNASELAGHAGDDPRWRVAMRGTVEAYITGGDLVAATAAAERILERGRARRDDTAIAVGLGELGRCARHRGDLEAAVALGWDAVGHADDRETLGDLLTELGTTLAALGYLAAAARCHTVVALRPRDPEQRARARLELAELALLGGRADQARERVRSVIEAARGLGDVGLMERVDAILERLEAESGGERAAPPAAQSETARRIAAEVEAFSAALIPASPR